LDRLEVETVIPGHGPLTSAAVFSRNIGYLTDLIHEVRAALRAGKSLEETLASVEFKEPWAPPPGSLAVRLPNLRGTHTHNVQRTYEDQLRSRG
ncbi:MAG: hypothetical protein IT307_11865, partial [Chloroflexi bacterium]|nr:hypothetical protein [Chloroflexota bacterium]